MKENFAVILAAGQGTRMKSEKAKVLHELAGRPMISHLVDRLTALDFKQIITIIGHEADAVKEELAGRTDFAFQAEQLGTAHAVQTAAPLLAGKTGNTLVLAGDTPLITTESFEKLIQTHEEEAAKATILTACVDDPTNYGRIIREADGSVKKIVEEKDANAEEKAVQEINTGTFIFDNESLLQALKKVDNHNAQGEYYLPDVIEILKAEGETVAAYALTDPREALGINDRQALSQGHAIFYQRQNERFMAAGVTMLDPQTVYIEADVEIGPDTVIEPDVQILAGSRIGKNCHLGSGTIIRHSRLADGVSVRSSEIEESEVGAGSDIGPNAHLRPHSILHEQVHIGNFVEIKKAEIGAGTKIGHLTYVGDATIGKRVNVSCGVIFCNYDGVEKAHSSIGDDAFIGSNVNIVSPVTVADKVFIAAGSTVTEDVPSEAMAIARARQTNKPDYWAKLPISKKGHNK